MNPWTVRVWQGNLIFECGDSIYRIAADKILGVLTYMGAVYPHGPTPSPVIIVLAERELRLWRGDLATARRLRDEILAALNEGYWWAEQVDALTPTRPNTTKVES